MRIPLLLGFSGILAAAIAMQGSSADSLLERHTKQLQTATTLSAEYTYQKFPGGPVDYKLKLAKPAKFRLETPDEVVVADGMTITTLKKSDNSYTQVPQKDDDLKKFLKREGVLPWSAFFVKEPFKDAAGAKVGANRTIKGKPVTEVSIVLAGKPERDVTFYMDSSLGIARGVSLKVAPDQQTLIMAKEISVAADSATDSDFSFTVPSGAKKVDPAAVTAATFTQVSTIFQANCVGCHNATRPRSGLDLSSYAGTMAGGQSGKDVIAGDADNSPIMAFLKANGKPIMPPRGALSDADIATIANWIKGGATQN